MQSESEGSIPTALADTYMVVAKRWNQGWELDVEGIGGTQTRVLATADQRARELIETITGQDASVVRIDLHFDIDGLEQYVRAVRQQTGDAQTAARKAAATTREVVHTLRTSYGLSVSDVATILGVSRGRISQLSLHSDTP